MMLIGNVFPTPFYGALKGVTLNYMNDERNSPGAKEGEKSYEEKDK